MSFLRDPALEALGVDHGFGLRTSPEVPLLVRPRQVHGAAVASIAERGEEAGEADAVVCTATGVAVGIATADCVPILVAAATATGAEAVAAVHAGWRGLADGVIPAALDALRNAAPGVPITAAVGPHIGPCCYEVDDPVTSRLAPRFGAALAEALCPSRPGHGLLDLGALTRESLRSAGVAPDAIGTQATGCTQCDPVRFHSFRRDGALAGRLLHWIRAPGHP